MMKGELAMATSEARLGELVDVRPLESALASSERVVLLRAEQVEIIRLVVPAGKEIPEHKAKGEIVVQCLEGRVAYNAFGKTLILEAGKLLYMPMGEPHSVKGIEDASLLLTVFLPKHR
jgi:quercetin dioxygenase-like cupin family protein